MEEMQKNFLAEMLVEMKIELFNSFIMICVIAMTLSRVKKNLQLSKKTDGKPKRIWK